MSHTTYNRERVKEYFYKYGQEEYYEEIVEKKVKANELRFCWDKKAQSYMENQDYFKTEKNIIHSLEEYFYFLEYIEPACINPQENQIIYKQFIL